MSSLGSDCLTVRFRTLWIQIAADAFMRLMCQSNSGFDFGLEEVNRSLESEQTFEIKELRRIERSDGSLLRVAWGNSSSLEQLAFHCRSVIYFSNILHWSITSVNLSIVRSNNNRNSFSATVLDQQHTVTLVATAWT